jgi:AcrR family transcriptional regulator
VIHSEQSSEDLRVQRTRRLILEALIELTIQKGFAAVTVRDITTYAGINRATFYRHYTDKFDLLDQYARGIYQLLDATPAPTEEGTGTSASGLVTLFEHIRHHAKFYRIMLGKNGDPAFAEKIRRYVEQRMLPWIPEAQRDTTLGALYLSFISSGSIGVVLWWLEHDLPFTAEEMAEISHQLSSGCLDGLFGQAGHVGREEQRN